MNTNRINPNHTIDKSSEHVVSYYNTTYNNFSNGLYKTIRHNVFGNEDIGQTGWLTSTELQKFIECIGLTHPGSYLLDICSGMGGPTITTVKKTQCRAIGVDIMEQAVIDSNTQASNAGISHYVKFIHHDADLPLPFEPETFDAIICIDAIIHLKNRITTLRDWSRMLKPGGRILYTDTCVITGLISKEELAIRSSIGYFTFTPPGINEQLIEMIGLKLLTHCDVTTNMAQIAHYWHTARSAYEAELREVEGNETYDGQQTFFEVTSFLAQERRLSRFLYVAEKPLHNDVILPTED